MEKTVSENTIEKEYKDLLWTIISKFPSFETKVAATKFMLDKITEISCGTEKSNNFNHGFIYVYDEKDPRQFRFYAASQGAESYRREIQRLIEEIPDRRSMETKLERQTVTQWVRENNKSLIIKAEIEDEKVNITCYKLSTRRSEKQKKATKLKEPRLILSKTLEEFYKEASSKKEVPQPEPLGRFWLISPIRRLFIVKIEKEKGPRKKELLPESEIMSFLFLSFKNDLSVENNYVDLNSIKEIRDIETLVSSVSYITSEMELVERDNVIKELIKRRLQVQGLVATATLFSGIRHRMAGQIRSVDEDIEDLKKIVEMPECNRSSLKALAQDIANRFNSLSNSVRYMREFSRDAGEIEFDPGKDIREIVKEVAWLLDLKQLPLKEIYFRTRFSSGVPQKMTLPSGAIRTLLYILLENAKEAVEESETKKISLFVKMKNRNELYIKVSDSGQGIKQEDKDTVFKMFWTTKNKAVHTGLGLTMVKTLLSELDGSIRLDSKSKQTSFEILLPLTERKNA